MYREYTEDEISDIAAHIIRYGEYAVNFNHRTLTLPDGRTVHLTPLQLFLFSVLQPLRFLPIGQIVILLNGRRVGEGKEPLPRNKARDIIKTTFSQIRRRTKPLNPIESGRKGEARYRIQ